MHQTIESRVKFPEDDEFFYFGKGQDQDISDNFEYAPSSEHVEKCIKVNEDILPQEFEQVMLHIQELRAEVKDYVSFNEVASEAMP
mmetsp:Transcript_8508/g.7546  ORF Transcript_8508/g.7546 Transcript_8508/m.7546 type:complete len:86 (+) Transcript_8508:758-1015(+)|eukprot:CAMPEP_0114593668 /NCGR_PEP_ID=MMETSP0125-20121206/15257_1 /TAXON_ID=485358 ORGANISM="Aristerostoma sp., Strain ATCC 50986" /NCGR_SAMPLE_ID=MMETSP0125 /ASSEMBLY_ACC=CAM_ASM_000245 /LENGTH=85 /DNA_ID=CAMNT_0001793067 /DNA_START=260 /DNA_END=517 /DNA_ORIENTATION=+